MIWTEQKNKKEGTYTYKVEDFFGSLELTTNTRLIANTLDSLFILLQKYPSGENDFVLKTGDGIINLHYKLIKNTKPLWEKLSQEELLKE